MLFSRSLSISFLLTALSGPTYSAFAQEITPNEAVSAVGEYFLVRANSQELPAVVSESGGARQEVWGGSVRLQADGTHIWTTRYRYTESRRTYDSDSSGRGTYLQQGTSIIFKVEVGDDGFEGTLQGNTLTIQSDVPMVYRKIFGQRPAEAFREPNQGGRLPPPPSSPSNSVSFALPLAGPPPDSITFSLPLAPGLLPRSIEELCDSSILIAEAYVQSVLAPREGVKNLSGIGILQEGSFPFFRFLETDSILEVSRVLKGSESIPQVVISQKGGVVGSYSELPIQYHLMQPAERYILFLADEARTDLPDVRGIPRYALNGSWTGLFRINENVLHLSPDTADVIREQFDGRSSQDVITEIQRCSQP